MLSLYLNKTDVARTKTVVDIATNDIEQTMTTTDTRTIETTGTNHGIHGTIGFTIIEVHAIIDGPPTIIAEHLLTPNLVGLSHTPSRGTTRPTNGLTPRLHERPRTTHTRPHKKIEERQAT